MADHNAKNNLLWGAILILFGLLFLLDNFDIMDFGDIVRTFWPVVLILIGVKIILDKKRANSKPEREVETGVTDEKHKTSSSLSESNVFGYIKIIIDSQKFTGGSINNVFGNIQLDLSKVQLDQDLVKVYVSGIFGDLTVVLPEGITHRVKASAVAGDLMVFGNKREGLLPSLEHRAENYDNAKSKLFLQASIVFGSVKIKSE